MINFAKGHPNRKLLPLQEIKEIFAKVALPSNEERLKDSLNYPKSDPGHPQLLDELRAFMDRHAHSDDLGSHPSVATESPIPTTEFFMTHGVSHGLDMLCTTQTSPGDVVLIERPTYFLAAGIFQSHGLHVHTLPMKEDSPGGIDLDRLEHSLQSGELKPPKMIYIIPTHQNPTARVMPIEDRWRLACLAQKYGIMVVADEVYHLLDWRNAESDGPRPARMAVIDSHLRGSVDNGESSSGCCVTVSSFTKIFSPGIRCGWIEGPKSIVQSLEDLGYIQSQGGCTPLIGELMYASLSTGIGDRVLAKLNTAFRERSERLCQILQADEGIRLETRPLGGYFIWLTFDGVDDTKDLLELCSERGIRFLPGERCDVSGPNDAASSTLNDCRRWARLCFADLDMEDIEKGAGLLLDCYREYLQTRSK